jgi:hypothetical protein
MTPGFNHAMMDAKTDVQLTERMSGIFKTYQGRYRKAIKTEGLVQSVSANLNNANTSRVRKKFVLS